MAKKVGGTGMRLGEGKECLKDEVGEKEEEEEGEGREKIKNGIKEYVLSSIHPRDFNSDIPILETLGASEYDKLGDLSELQISLEAALTKFRKDWRTLD